MRPLKYFWRIYREIIIALALCLVGFGGLLFGVVPAGRGMLDAWGEIQTLRREIEGLGEKAASLDALPEDTLEDQLRLITSAIPTDKAVPSVFATVERVAKTTGVDIIDMSVTQAGSLATASAQRVSAEEKALGASLLPFSLTVKGSMEEVRAFIGRIGAVRRLSRIRNFDLAATAANEVQARLSLDAFYVPLPTAVGTINAPITPLSQQQQEALAQLASFPWLSQPAAASPPGPVFGTKQNPFSR